MLELAKIFCIDVCAFAVMSNHTHLVLYVDNKKANRLNDKAIVIRYSVAQAVQRHRTYAKENKGGQE
ncbi:hypothetical protein PspMM1_17600 [Pseudoalteromonas sp. MM1]|nr:hypothetical protein PspMM1_17600 [Pseudoalteromonas sp. MM1]